MTGVVPFVLQCPLGDVPDGGALADAGVPLLSSDAKGGGEVEEPSSKADLIPHGTPQHFHNAGRPSQSSESVDGGRTRFTVQMDL